MINRDSIEKNRIHKVDEVGSTNDHVKQLMKSNEIRNGDVIISGYQSSGKGQSGNSWESESGKNLLFSLYLEDFELKAEDQFLISKCISLGILNYLKTKKDGFKIKWPNDIYFEEKKIAGILIENTIMSNNIKSSIIGVGLNVNQTQFSDELPNPVSLQLITGNEFNLDDELKALIGYLNKYLSRLKSTCFSDIHNQYLQSIYRINEDSEFRTNDSTFIGKINNVDKYGRIIIIDSEGYRKVFGFKEVEFVK